MSCFNRRVGAWCATAAVCLAAALTVSILKADSERRVRDVLNSVSTLLDTPDEVSRDVSAIFAQREAIIQRCLQVVDPTSKDAYGEKQRAAAAFLLGEFRAIEAVPSLMAMLPYDVKASDWDPTPYDHAAYTSLAKIGRDALPAVVDLLKETDNPVLRKKCVGLIGLKVGTKRYLLDTLGRLADAEPDPVKAQRVRDARAWADTHNRESKGEPAY
jgi:HEAT repeat protein